MRIDSDPGLRARVFFWFSRIWVSVGMRAAKSGALTWVSADGIEIHPFFIDIFFALWVVVNIAAHLYEPQVRKFCVLEKNYMFAC